MKEEGKAVRITPGLARALDETLDENTTQSLEEMFVNIMNEFMSNALAVINRQRKYGKQITESERIFQEDCMVQMRSIDKAMTIAKRHNLYVSKPVENAEKDLLSMVRNKSNSMAEIVATLPVKDDIENAV